MALLIAIAVILAVVCVVLIIFLLKGSKDENATGGSSVTTDSDIVTPADNLDGSEEVPGTPVVYTDRLQISLHEAKDKYNVPDIGKGVTELSENVNPDIYAVVTIPGCNIEEPVCQRVDDEFYYSSHNEKGEEDENGCVYTQVFNTKDFTDNLTVMYGRNIGDGKRFTNLHYYEDPVFMESNPYIYVFTDRQVLVYEIFGAYKYDALHLIVGFDTNSEEGYNNYMVAISQIEPELNDNFNSETVLKPEDKMLTLSTGITGDQDHRYLVQGMLIAKADIDE